MYIVEQALGRLVKDAVARGIDPRPLSVASTVVDQVKPDLVVRRHESGVVRLPNPIVVPSAGGAVSRSR